MIWPFNTGRAAKRFAARMNNLGFRTVVFYNELWKVYVR